MLKRRAKKDPVTPQLRLDVLKRDGGCMAPVLDQSQSLMCSGPLTLDHVKDQPRMGKRAPSDERHLVTLCRYHHIDSGWATGHRPLLRQYLAEVADGPVA